MKHYLIAFTGTTGHTNKTGTLWLNQEAYPSQRACEQAVKAQHGLYSIAILSVTTMDEKQYKSFIS